MSSLEFVSSVVTSLAWPIAVVTIAFLFRAEIRQLLTRQVRRLRAGPVEVEFDRLLSEVEVELDQPEVAAARQQRARLGLLESELAETAVRSPSAAVMQAHASIERALREIVAAAEPDAKLDRLGAAGLARQALELGLITPETANAVEGITVLRNLAAHGRAGEVSAERALDYIALAEAVMFAIRQKVPVRETGRDKPATS